MYVKANTRYWTSPPALPVADLVMTLLCTTHEGFGLRERRCRGGIFRSVTLLAHLGEWASLESIQEHV